MRTADSCVILEPLPGGLGARGYFRPSRCVQARLLRAHASIKRRRNRWVSNNISMRGAAISRQELCPELVTDHDGPKLENRQAIRARVNTEPPGAGGLYRGINTGDKARSFAALQFCESRMTISSNRFAGLNELSLP